jgi:alanine racemase
MSERRQNQGQTTSRLEIDLDAAQRNTRRVMDLITRSAPAGAAQPLLCAVLKQNAYAMGIERLARRVAAGGADMIAVYAPQEARAIVETAVDLPVLVFMPAWNLDRLDPVHRLAASGRLHLTLHGLEHAKAVEALAGRLGAPAPVHVQLDTGMSRGGCREEEATRVVEHVLNCRRLNLAGLMTHFSAAGTDEQTTREQAERFDAWVASLGDAAHGARQHLCATSGVFRAAPYHAGMVRIGQGLFGYTPGTTEDPSNEFAREATKLEHALRWITSVVHEEEIPTGWPVGYGSIWRAQRPTRIAVVPVGYAAGYPRALGNGGTVAFTGEPFERRGRPPGQPLAPPRPHFAPVVGRVSMDQITIDVTDVPRELTRPGMEVELLGRDPNAPHAMPAVAKAAATIPHDVMCGITERVQRVYRVTTEDARTAAMPPSTS